jgi:ubiquitin carboxyl-terminal hydrolase 47
VKKSEAETIAEIEKKNKELLEKYKMDGPFVYELYAVMVHQGGTFGGHYYAYIQDLENKKWFNFNDTQVSPISIIDVVEMFGPPPA